MIRPPPRSTPANVRRQRQMSPPPRGKSLHEVINILFYKMLIWISKSAFYPCYRMVQVAGLKCMSEISKTI
nr:hypothetical protein [Pedobacter sp. ASV19]